jgi:hypothetical protein
MREDAITACSEFLAGAAQLQFGGGQGTQIARDLRGTGGGIA